MKTGRTVFLGGGRITGAMVAGLRLAGIEEAIVVYDRHPEKLRKLRQESRIDIAHDLRSALRRAETLIVAVRPASVEGILDEAGDYLTTSAKLCISLAAGVPLRKLRGKIPNAHWVRAMPSPVCRVGRGLTALCFERSVTKRERGWVLELFGRVGQVIEIPESRFDAFTTVYSSSHGYHALAALAKAGGAAGLDRTTALTAAAHALSDGISYWRDSQDSVADLLEEAATPGGIAAATMAAMDKAGYSRTVSNGIRAGIRRARLNGKR